MRRTIRCPDCDGEATFSPFQERGDGKCSVCHGTGYASFFDQLAASHNPFLNEEEREEESQCDSCGGSKVCQTCHGEGTIEEDEEDEE